MEYPTSSMNSGQSTYTSHQQDTTRISPGCNPQPNPTSFPGGDTGPHSRGYGPYPPAYQTSNEFGGPGGHTAPNPATYSHVYPPESHGQSLTLNQLLQQGSTPNNYPTRPHGGPPMQASYRAYEQYPYGYKPGVPGNAGERPQGNTYPYAGAQGQRYTDPYGRPTYPNYPPGSNYPYYQSPPMAQQPPQRQQPASSQVHPMEFNNPNSGLPSRSAQPNIVSPGAAGQHVNDRPPSGSMNAHAHPSLSPVHSSQMSSPLHASALNTTQAPGWSSHTSQPPFGSPHQLAPGQPPSQQQNRPRSASRDSQHKAASDSSGESHVARTELERNESQPNDPTGLDDPGSRPHSRLSDSGRPSTANSTGSAGLRDRSSDEQNTAGSTMVSVPASSSVTEANLNGAALAPMDSSPSVANSTYVTNPTLSPIPTTPRGTPPSHPYSVFSQSCGTPVSLQSGQTVTSQPNAGPSRPPSQPNQSPRPYGMPPQSPMGPRQPYPPYMHQLPPQQQQQQQQPHYIVGSPRPGFYSSMGVTGGGATGAGPGPGSGVHPSMRPSMHPMGPAPGMGMNRSGPPGSFFQQGMMPPPAAPPPPQQQQPNSNQVNLAGQTGPGGGAQAGFMPGGPYPNPSGLAGGPSNNVPWESHPQTPATSMSSGVTSAMSQSHFGAGRPSPIYSGAVDRGMGYPGSPQPNAISSGSSVPHTQPSMSIAPGGYPHAQPPPAYPSHGQHPQMPYPSTQLPSYPSHGPAHPYPPGMIPPGAPAQPYPTSMVPSGPGAPVQPGREQLHSQYGNDVVPASERGPPPLYCSVPLSVASGADPSTFSTSMPGGSPSGMVRGVPVATIGGKLPPGAVLGKMPKMDTGIRSVTPNNAGPPMTNASTHVNVSSVSGVLDEPPVGMTSLPSHQLPQSGAGVSALQQQQLHQQHQSQPHNAMQQSNQSGMQPFHGGSGGYWSESGPPGQFASSMPPSGMGSQGPHGFIPFQQHYRMPGSNAPLPQSMPQQQQQLQQHPHGMPNSIGCPNPPTSPMYGSTMGPYGNAHALPSGHTISSQSSSVFHRLLGMGTEPERRPWLEHYVRFMEEIGKPLVGLPQVVKQPLDLYRFYLAVRERGGVLEVIKARRWKEISQLVKINASASAAYTLRKNYCKFLLDYECRFDRCGADPTPLLAHIEAMSGKKKKASSTDDGLGNLSISGQSLSSSQAPPSPAGSHSSASSSLLPPGSGSASLSGVPSGTAGSAASDSQLGPSCPQSRFGDPCAQSATSTVDESPNGMINSPSSGIVTSHSSGSAAFSQSSARSPQRPPSTTTLNGYSNAPHGPGETLARSSANWPWISDSMVSAPHQSPVVSVNGFPAAMSPVRGPLSLHGMTHGLDVGCRPNATTSVPSPKSTQPRVSTPVSNMTPVPQPARSPVCSTMSSNTAGGVGLPSPGSNVQAPVVIKGPDPAMHHHHLTSQYPPSGGQPCPIGAQQQQQPLSQQQQPATQPHHPQFMGQHPGSPMHPSMQHTLPPGAPVAPPPGSPMHPRLGMPGVRGPPPPVSAFSGPVAPTHTLGTPGTDSIALLRMHNIRPSSGPQMPAYPPNAMPPFHGQAASAAANVPAHLVHHHGQRPGYVATILKRIEHYPFPPGSVEATQVEMSRRRRYRAKDIGAIAPFKLLMALRSGLTAEVSWALNCLNILLRDESGLDSFTGTSLTALITNLAELWRHSLGEIFDHDLFVCSLELPTNLASFGQVSDRSVTEKRMGFALDSPKSIQSSEMQVLRNPWLKNSLSITYTTPNGLVNLERDLVALANARGVSIASLRDGIRRILRKCGDPVNEFLPIRARNGLMLNSIPVVPVNSSATPHPMLSVDSAHSGSRTRKRGSRHMSTGFGHMSSNYSAGLHGLAVTATTGAHNFVSQTIKSENAPPWITARVTTAANSLRSPEAYTNLRELALFVIDELFEFKPSPETPGVHTSGKQEVVVEPSRIVAAREEPNPEAYLSASEYLRKLIIHGGGDTTCHIMPPFGAAPYPSKHWRGEMTSLSESGRSRCEILRTRKTSSTPPPPEVGEKCPPRGDLMDYEVIESLEDEAHIPNKRVRHASTSSLPCPVLSPQPIEEVPDDSESKPLISRTVPDSTPTSSRPEESVRVYSPSDNRNGNDASLDDHDDTEFSQLVMDTSGRCPLRAREELVHHGPACLWPDHLEANDYEARAVRCLCVSTVLRNLSFWHLAEVPLSSHKPTLALIGRIILLGHEHVGPNDTWQSVEQTSKLMEPSQCAWRTPTWLEDMRENALVLLVNLAGYLKLIQFEESIVRPILEGLLHWINCPTAAAIDSFPGHRTLSPRRLALEALNRLCVHESNVDLLLSTPGSREADLHLLFGRLANWLALPEDQVTRELALSTMHYLTGGGASFNTLVDSTPGKILGPGLSSTTQCGTTSFIGTTLLSSAKPCPVAGLLAFIEAAEATTRRVIDQCGVQALQERPELMGTSLEMVRRAGALLDRLAADPTGRTRFTPTLELRLLDLVTSRVLDATVAHLLCGALHRLSQNRPVTEEKAEPEPITTPLVPPIPSLSVVAQLIQNAANVSPTKPEPLPDTNETVSGVVEAAPHSSTITSDENNFDAPSTPVVVNAVDKDDEKTCTDDQSDDNVTLLKDTVLPPKEPFNHVDDSSCVVSVKKECGAIELVENHEPAIEKKETSLPPVIAAAVDSSSWNLNCVDS